MKRLTLPGQQLKIEFCNGGIAEFLCSEQNGEKEDELSDILSSVSWQLIIRENPDGKFSYDGDCFTNHETNQTHTLEFYPGDDGFDHDDYGNGFDEWAKTVFERRFGTHVYFNLELEIAEEDADRIERVSMWRLKY
jgi:hypothetical protein